MKYTVYGYVSQLVNVEIEAQSLNQARSEGMLEIIAGRYVECKKSARLLDLRKAVSLTRHEYVTCVPHLKY
jgi:hypothetical protein